MTIEAANHGSQRVAETELLADLTVIRLVVELLEYLGQVFLDDTVAESLEESGVRADLVV